MVHAEHRWPAWTKLLFLSSGDAIQINIGNGRHGYRIVGPKFGASGSQLLKRVALTKRDATEIARYLAEVTDA